jgi:uncharacterized RDD family membrane protein YckC
MAKFCARHPENQAVAFCVKCGAPMCPACENPVDGRPWCGECFEIRRREQLIQSIQQLQPSEETVRRAKRAVMLPISNKEARRIIALLIDAAAVIAFSLPVSAVLWGLSFLVMPIVHGVPFGLACYISLLLTGTVYYVVAHWKWGRTIGKRFLGLKVYRTNGKPVTFTGAFWRWVGLLTVLIWAYVGVRIAKFIFFITSKAGSIDNEQVSQYSGYLYIFYAAAVIIALFLSLGVLITFVGKYKRGFHDIIGGTIVKSEGWEGPEPGRRVKVPLSGGMAGRKQV